MYHIKWYFPFKKKAYGFSGAIRAEAWAWMIKVNSQDHFPEAAWYWTKNSGLEVKQTCNRSAEHSLAVTLSKYFSLS